MSSLQLPLALNSSKSAISLLHQLHMSPIRNRNLYLQGGYCCQIKRRRLIGWLSYRSIPGPCHDCSVYRMQDLSGRNPTAGTVSGLHVMHCNRQGIVILRTSGLRHPFRVSNFHGVQDRMTDVQILVKLHHIANRELNPNKRVYVQRKLWNYVCYCKWYETRHQRYLPANNVNFRLFVTFFKYARYHKK